MGGFPKPGDVGPEALILPVLGGSSGRVDGVIIE